MAAAGASGKTYSFKAVLLGEGCVGKTSLVLRYCENKFNDKHITTLQVRRPLVRAQLVRVLDPCLRRAAEWTGAAPGERGQRSPDPVVTFSGTFSELDLVARYR